MFFRYWWRKPYCRYTVFITTVKRQSLVFHRTIFQIKVFRGESDIKADFDKNPKQKSGRWHYAMNYFFDKIRIVLSFAFSRIRLYYETILDVFMPFKRTLEM